MAIRIATERKDGGLPLWGAFRRYWVDIGGERLLDRWVLITCPWFSVLLTRIWRPDSQRDPHDHSRWFASLILSGGYTEEVFSDPVLLASHERRHGMGSVHVMRMDQAHSITEVRGILCTLLLAGRSRGTWAFWTPQGKVDWKEYG